MLTLVAYAVCTGLLQFYTTVQVLLVLMLILHALTQPYQKKWHNAVDVFLFADLAVINGLTLFVYSKAMSLDRSAHISFSAVSIIQLVLIYLPLLYIAAYVSSRVAHTVNLKIRMCAKWRENLTTMESSNNSDFPARLFCPRSDEFSERNLEYHEFDNSSPVHELEDLSSPNN